MIFYIFALAYLSACSSEIDVNITSSKSTTQDTVSDSQKEKEHEREETLSRAAATLVGDDASSDNKGTAPVSIATDQRKSYDSNSVNFKGSIRRDLALLAAMECPEKNVVISPISVVVILAQLLLGATGETAQELVEAVGTVKNQLSRDFKHLLGLLNHKDEITINLASKLYVDQSTKLLPVFEKKSKIIFDSSVQKLPFSKSSQSAKIINDWVSQETNNKIKDLIKAADLQNPKIVAINAIYFQGTWQKSFEAAKPGKFTTKHGDVTVPMMRSDSRFKYLNSKVLDAKVIRIPYKGKETSMVIILPSGKNHLTLLLRKLKLAPELMYEALAALQNAEVELSMPKFKIEHEINLKPLCEKLGIKKIFAPNAELTEMTAAPHAVSKMKQKAFIEVTERGTEAAAATATMMVMMSAMQIPKETMKVDHPFFYIIQTQNEIIFTGIVNTP